MEDETTYGLRPERLARLLALGMPGSGGHNDPGANRTPAELLLDKLHNELPLDASDPESLPSVLNWPSDKVLAARGKTMSDLLTDSKTDLAVIKALKDYGKELTRRGGSEAKQAAAIVIYYAAIASALVFHHYRITDHSYHNLNEAYTQLEHKPWIPSELKELFKKASGVCQQRKGKRP